MRAWTLLTAVTALLAAASGGAFLTYSTFTTAGLARLPAADGLAAMQQLNVTAPRSATFMALIFAPAALCLVLVVRVVVVHPDGTGWVLAGAVVYVLGVVGVTVGFHVPRNEALAGLDPLTQAGEFAGWLSAWVRGNHVRTASGLVSAGLLALSLR